MLETKEQLLEWAKAQSQNEFSAKQRYMLNQEGLYVPQKQWRRTFIRFAISDGLYTQLASIWKKKSSRWGGEKFTGARTPLGVAELLFDKDTMKQVRVELNSQKKEEARKKEIASENYRRARIRKLAQEIVGVSPTYGAMTIAELLVLQDLETD